MRLHIGQRSPVRFVLADLGISRVLGDPLTRQALDDTGNGHRAGMATAWGTQRGKQASRAGNRDDAGDPVAARGTGTDED